MDDLYHQQILEHYHDPLNYGKIDNSDVTHSESNQSCGDAYIFYIKLSKDKSSIGNISFEGEGCAISKAACSLLTEKLKGQNIKTISQLDTNFMLDLIGANITTTRMKCLLLPLKAIYKVSSKLKPTL